MKRDGPQRDDSRRDSSRRDDFQPDRSQQATDEDLMGRAAGGELDRLAAVAQARGLLELEATAAVARDRLTALLSSDPNVAVRLAAVDALQGEPLDAEILTRLLRSEASPLLRIALVDRAAFDPSLQTLLEELARSATDPDVRRRARWAAATAGNPLTSSRQPRAH